jgi:ABC-type transport system involved in multi-copper enzyme maturation permease subunit
MTWIIARKEIVSNLLSYKFFVVLLLTIVLVLMSFFIMHRDFKNRLSDYQVIRPKAGDPIALLPPNPLSIFAKGLDDALARSFEMSVIGVSVRAGQASGNIIFSFFPTPDFLYIVKVVLSLVALLFGFEQVSREKEIGTLRLMLANRISRAKVLLGKWLGNFLSLSIPFLLVSGLGFAFLNLDSEIRFSGERLGRFLLILLIALIYIALFLSLGILISTLTKKAATSLVLLLFIWAAAVFIFPNLGTLLARQMVDIPSVRALSEKREQTWTREVLLGEKDSNWKTHYERITAEVNQREEDFRNKFLTLIRLSKNINRVSPVASFVYLTTDLAGTGISEEMNLKQEVIRYNNQVLPDLTAGRQEVKNMQLQVFQYRYRPLSQILAEGALFDIAWLVFFNILLFALSYFAFVKYDVR